MEARRTEIGITLDEADISADIRKHLISMTYTDNEEGESDDLQLTLDDKDGELLGTEMATIFVSKGAEIAAVIVQKNWGEDSKDSLLDCGIFSIDTIDGNGPPAKVTVKATSILQDATIQKQPKTKAWEKYTLSGIANEIARVNGFRCMFESDFNPLYERKEQMQESDIAFLQRLCTDAGISLKVTAKMIVLFDAAAYEQKETVRTIERGKTAVSRYSFSTTEIDTAYSSCHVSYTDPTTAKTIEYTYTVPDPPEEEKVLEVNEKVSSTAEAKTLAIKRLRQKNKGEYNVTFDLAGDTLLVAGVTVEIKGYGAFDGKYIVETATHSVSNDGYKTNIKTRRVLQEDGSTGNTTTSAPTGASEYLGEYKLTCYCSGCNSPRGSRATACGTPATAGEYGTIAVHPSLYRSLGVNTVLYIEGIGYRKVQDKHGVSSGIIDIYVGEGSCKCSSNPISGRRAKVYIVK